MDAGRLIDRLAAGGPLFAALFAGVDPQQAAWRPAPGKWSLLEVAAHLLDEEREDFRRRLELVLDDPRREWPPIDPPGWVTSRAYAERDLAATAGAFVAERAASVAWLRGLARPDWDAAHAHPTLGEITAGDLLASWVAHDALHLRQAAGLAYGYVRRLAGSHSPAYAGEW
ncbi:MAG: DinB family protein [Acidobacteriota bacterium]|nr:DinB family protein [Acidobacteriota bacterium]